LSGELPTIIYQLADDSYLVFERVCPKCGRFVKAKDYVMTNVLGELKEEPNAECSRCGPVMMPSLGYFGEDDLS